MTYSPTAGRVANRTASDLAAVSRDTSSPLRPVRGVVAYYRLRSIALEARVKQLEAEVERAQRQLQETIERYEQILQHRPGNDGVVSVDESSCPDG